jgi:Rrf2 family cysteine metabolism transcriptional repressor
LNFTAKEDYGIRAVLDIAIHQQDAPIQAREIASRQDIPEQFLEQLLAILRRAGVIRSIRGASGGYDLAKPASQISVGDILRVLSGPLVPMACVNEDTEKCARRDICSAAGIWQRVAGAISDVVDNTTMQDLVDEQRDIQSAQSFMMNI